MNEALERQERAYAAALRQQAAQQQMSEGLFGWQVSASENGSWTNTVVTDGPPRKRKKVDSVVVEQKRLTG